MWLTEERISSQVTFFAYTNIAEIELFARPYAETWRAIYEEDHSLKEVII